MLTFRTFKDAPAAQELAQWLSDRGIRAESADISPHFDPSFAHSILTREWAVRLPAEDFSQATVLLRAFYELRLRDVPPDYYLFSFTDGELEDILRKPDEWGDLDFALARHILAERGRGISDAELTAMQEKRYAEIRRPEAARDGHSLVSLGYVLSFAGGLLGSLVGWHLAYSRKILPDGVLVPRYDAQARKHGKLMFRIGILVFILFGLLKLYQAYRMGVGNLYP